MIGSPDNNVRLTMYQFLHQRVVADGKEHSMTWGTLTMTLAPHEPNADGEPQFRMKCKEWLL